ncbi:uncharacterized protein [Tiliqua scincoides]|uniref:uncharacterized protein n=1 Tax=Tiliqua scincoides TaxID=71010 RepID=UPI003461BB05
MASPLKSSPSSLAGMETPQMPPESETPAKDLTKMETVQPSGGTPQMECESNARQMIKMERPKETENVPPSGGETPVRPADSQNYIRQLFKMESPEDPETVQPSGAETPDRPTDSQSLPPAPMKKKQKRRRYVDDDDEGGDGDDDDETSDVFPSLNLVYQFAMEDAPVPRKTEAENGSEPEANPVYEKQDAYKTLRSILGVLPLDRHNNNLTSQTRQRITKSVLRASLFAIVKYCVSKYLEVACEGCRTRAPAQDGHECLDWSQDFIRDKLHRVMKKINIGCIIHTCVCVAFSLGCLEIRQDFPEYLMSLLHQLQKFDSEPHKTVDKLIRFEDRVLLFSVGRVVKAKSFWFYLN